MYISLNHEMTLNLQFTNTFLGLFVNLLLNISLTFTIFMKTRSSALIYYILFLTFLYAEFGPRSSLFCIINGVNK